MKNFILIFVSSLFCFACVSTQEIENARLLEEAAAKPADNEAEIAEKASKACPVAEPFKSDLVETTWTPTFLKNQDNAPMPKGGEDGIVFLRFDKNLKVNGMSGNNLFSGDVIIAPNGSWRAVNFLSTRRMGPYDKYEYKFLQALHKADNIYLSSNGKVMRLQSDKDVLVEFKKIEHIQDK